MRKVNVYAATFVLMVLVGQYLENGNKRGKVAFMSGASLVVIL